MRDRHKFDMRLTLLQTYSATRATGSTQGASRLLGVSQSAVSRRLAQLEDELGLQLFIRDKGRLVPTRESELLDGEISALVDRGEQLANHARELRQGNSPAITLRVAFPASLTLSIVPAIIASFLEEHDKVQVELHTGTYDAIEAMLAEERADVGFVRVPVQRASLSVTELIRVPTVCVMPVGHPLTVNKVVRIRDLATVPLILLGRRRAPRRDLDEIFWRAGVRPKVAVEAHSVLSACGLVAAGLGVTLVNELMARDYMHLPLEIRPVDVDAGHSFALARLSDSPSVKAAEAFTEITRHKLREAFGQAGGTARRKD